MENLAPYQQNLPDTIDDVARFLLIAPEKARSLRAEIAAIEKLHLAQEVYEQKKQEQLVLAELILDASMKIGEFTKTLPRASGTRTDVRPKDSAVPGLDFQKTKEQATADLGFSKKQVQRMETLADNKDLVEIEKAAAREEGRVPTRTNVLNMAQERKRMREARYKSDMEQIDRNYEAAKAFYKIAAPGGLSPYADNENNIIDAVVLGTPDISYLIREIDKTIQRLSVIRGMIVQRKGVKRNGEK